jgi:hypothetical protein
VAFGLVSLLTFGGFARTGAGEEIIWNGTFDGRFEDKTHAIEVLERHNEEVKRRVPPERLLVYEVKEGWGPLCEFLGVPEPDEPFPHLNDAAEMRRGIRVLRALSVAVPRPWACWPGSPALPPAEIPGQVLPRGCPTQRIGPAAGAVSAAAG